MTDIPSQAQVRTTEEEILRTLRNINRTAVETDEVSRSTAEVINAQGEQIDNITRNAEKIEENLNTSERLIRGLKGWGGRLANFVSGTISAGDPANTKYPSYMPKAALAPSSASLQTHSSVPASVLKPANEFDAEVDRQLDNISNVLGNIHARSLELSDSISKQVKAVEAVDRYIDRSNDRIKRQHNDIKNLR